MEKSKPNKFLIVGLGNPGEKYKNTPHNAGFLTVDRLLETWNLKLETFTKAQSVIAEHEIGKKHIILAKPQTFMNNSGSSVKKLVSSFKISSFASPSPKASELHSKASAGKHVLGLWLVHDDIDLELGKIKIVKNRGSAGHKGVEDIIKKLKTKDFVRFRIGTRLKRIPMKRSKQMMNKFVASDLSRAEQTLFKKSIKRAAEALLVAIEEGIEKTASVYNR